MILLKKKFCGFCAFSQYALEAQVSYGLECMATGPTRRVPTTRIHEQINLFPHRP